MDLTCNLLPDHFLGRHCMSRAPRHRISWYATYGLTLHSLCPTPMLVTRYLQGQPHLWF